MFKLLHEFMVGKEEEKNEYFCKGVGKRKKEGERECGQETTKKKE